jgi:hypothetical protein
MIRGKGQLRYSGVNVANVQNRRNCVFQIRPLRVEPGQYPTLETASFARVNCAMTVSDQWSEILRCASCALTGVASLSQIGNGAVLIKSLPAGFKAV